MYTHEHRCSPYIHRPGRMQMWGKDDDTLCSLLKRPAAPTRAGGFTPLHLACVLGHAQVAQELLCARPHARMAALQEVDARDSTALHATATMGHAAVLAVLLQNRSPPELAVLLARSDHRACTPLHVACRAGHTDAVRTLLSFITMLPIGEQEKALRASAQVKSRQADS